MKRQTEILVSWKRSPPVRFQHRDDWYYATGRTGSFDDGKMIGMAYEYEAGERGARGLLIWVADDFKQVLHEPERDVDGRRDERVVRAKFGVGAV